jgi:hypothetical protein
VVEAALVYRRIITETIIDFTESFFQLLAGRRAATATAAAAATFQGLSPGSDRWHGIDLGYLD